MFGGSTDSKPNLPAKPLGVDASRLSTNEIARPVPWFCGQPRPFGCVFITPFFDVRTMPVSTGAGKQKTQSGQWFFASFAVLIGHGPLTRIDGFIFNDKEIEFEGGPQDFGSADYLDLTLAARQGYGIDRRVRVYAGTDTQLPDPYLNDPASYVEGSEGVTPEQRLHPGYRGFAYAVFERLFLGVNQTDAPNIQARVHRIPTFTWLGTPQTLDDSPKMCSPVGAIADLFLNPRAGLGVDDKLLNTTALSSVSSQLKAKGLGFAPYYDRAQEAGTILTDLVQYVDAFPLVAGDGRFSLGLVRPPASVGALPVVAESAFTRRPELPSGDWLTTNTEVDLRYTNPDDGIEAVAKYRDRGAYRITGEPSAVSLNRPFINDAQFAANSVAAQGRGQALPASAGTLYLRMTGTLYADLTPGALFVLNYPSRNLEGLVCRVQTRTALKNGRPEFTVTWKADRAYLSPGLAGKAAPAPSEPGDTVTPVALPISDVRVIELPLPLCLNGKLSLAILAARPDAQTIGYTVHISASYDWDGVPPASYRHIATHSRFALRGLVQEDYALDTDLVDLEAGLLVQLGGVDTEIGEVTAFDAVSDELLVFVGGEVLSVASATLVSAGQYRLFCLRERMGSPRQAHAADAEVFLMFARNLEPLRHPQFELGNTATLKLGTRTAAATLDLGDASPIEVPITGRIYGEPGPANLRSNGQLAGANYHTGDDLEVTWTLTDAQADFYQSAKVVRQILLEVLDATDALVETIALAGDLDTHTIANADLATWLGGETDFTLRLTLRTIVEAGHVDSATITLAVTKL